QMVTIGRALMSKPTILILDEASLGIAPKLVSEIFEKIHELRKGGLTVLMVEQNAYQALRIADFGYVMQEGKIVKEGPPDQLLDLETCGRPTSRFPEDVLGPEPNTSEAGRPSRTRAFEDPVGPTIVNRVDQAVPDPNRALACSGGGLVAFDDLPRVAELVHGRREHLVREPHLIRVDDLLPGIAEALRLEGLGPEAFLVCQVEEHFIDRVESVRRGRDDDERLHGDIASVCLDVASDGSGEV